MEKALTTLSVSLGGFDTHADEKGAQAILLGVVSQGISKFMSQMRATNRSKDVVILVYSEFGRRVRGNASDGTDHGTPRIKTDAALGTLYPLFHAHVYLFLSQACDRELLDSGTADTTDTDSSLITSHMRVYGLPNEVNANFSVSVIKRICRIQRIQT